MHFRNAFTSFKNSLMTLKMSCSAGAHAGFLPRVRRGVGGGLGASGRHTEKKDKCMRQVFENTSF